MPELIINDSPFVQEISGPQDKNLRRIEERFSVTLIARGETFRIRGEDAQKCADTQKLLTHLSGMLQSGRHFDNGEVRSIIDAFGEDPGMAIGEVFSEKGHIQAGKRVVKPKSMRQKEYLDAIAASDLVIGIGPAGTGKTYLAVAAAVSAYLQKQVARIILTRPAVEAGEKLGFLPGDLAEKINPYLRPLHDALFDMLDGEKVTQMMEQGQIEIAPLAFMRGRTLNDAFIILDEAQNTTPYQMKMFLTRLGANSKAVITGDITQVDLPPSADSGLIQARAILQDIDAIRFVTFSDKDVVRHELVKKILRAYDRHTERRADNR